MKVRTKSQLGWLQAAFALTNILRQWLPKNECS